MPEHGSPGRIIALINQKGGVGKTTTTVNLAAALAALGRPTLIVDLDPQAHATLSLGVDPGKVARTVYDLLLDWDDNADATVVQVRPNLAVIASETDLAAAEAELAPEPDRHKRLARALTPLASRFAAILIDCPPSLGMLTINALAAASEVIIPMQAHFLALQGVGKLLETVKLVRAKINPSLTVSGAIICMHDPSATHTQEVVNDIDAFFTQARGKGLPWSDARVFRPAVRRNIKLAECPSFGQSIFDYAPQAPGAADYKALAEAVFAPGATTASSPERPATSASAAAADKPAPKARSPQPIGPSPVGKTSHAPAVKAPIAPSPPAKTPAAPAKVAAKVPPPTKKPPAAEAAVDAAKPAVVVPARMAEPAR
jgi:chromosome partitioning protein